MKKKVNLLCEKNTNEIYCKNSKFSVDIQIISQTQFWTHCIFFNVHFLISFRTTDIFLSPLMSEKDNRKLFI